jgi:hypothetical protein
MRKGDYIISEELYYLCLEEMAKGFDRRFHVTKNVITNLQNRKYRLPKVEETRNIIYESAHFYVTKSPDDPFDLIYYLQFNVRLSRLTKFFDYWLTSRGFRPRFNEIKDIQGLFDDFALVIRAFYGFNPLITINKKIVEFRTTVILNTKTEFEIIEIGGTHANHN